MIMYNTILYQADVINFNAFPNLDGLVILDQGAFQKRVRAFKSESTWT